MIRRCTQLALIAILLLVSFTQADYLRTSRRATVKADPNRDAQILYRLDAAENLRLLSNLQENGYYEVELPDGSGQGWISRYLVRRHSGAVPGAPLTHSGLLEVHVIDVGQADAILIRCPDGNHEMLIDSGDNRYRGSGRQFKAYMGLHQSTDNEIEVVVATHPHADHIGNMAWVLDNYRVGLYVDNGNVYDTATYRRVEEAYARHSPSYWSAQDDLIPDVDFCPRDDVTAIVIRPNGFGESRDPNDNSVIVRIDYGDDSLLFVGDCGAEQEGILQADSTTRLLLDCDFLKVGHHCSDTSTSDDFLALVSPDIAAVSCGAKGVSTNSGYKHPRHEILSAIMAVTLPRSSSVVTMEAYESNAKEWRSITLNRSVFVTTTEGTLVFESDGNGIRKR